MIPEEVLDKIVSSYSEIKRTNDTYGRLICSYAFIGQEVEYFGLSYCHRAVWSMSDQVHTIVSSIPFYAPIDKIFYDMLLDQVFQLWQTKVSIKNHKGCKVLVVTDVQTIPRQTLLGLLIASRTPVEQAHRLYPTWSALCRAGVDEILAFLLSQHDLGRTSENPLNWVFEYADNFLWHIWISPQCDWMRVFHGKPIIGNPESHARCASIWGSDPGFWEGLEGKTVQQICSSMGFGIVADPDFPRWVA